MINFLSYIVYGFLKLLSYLPLGVLYIISDFVYFIVYKIIGYRKVVVTNNMKNAFPDKSEEEIIQLRKEFYHHFCDLFLETIKFWSISEEEIKKRCKFLNLEVSDKYAQENKSVIAILGHYCNWEWMTCFPIWGYENVLPIYKPLHNRTFDKMYIKIRERFGAKTLAKNDTLRTMLSYRRENKATFTVFIGDQTPNKRSINYWTQFLNQETPILQGTERIAKKLDQAVVFINMQKVKRGYYEVEFIPLFDNPKETAENEITEKHTRVLEEIINKNPAYWLWSHKRWKHKKQ